MALLVTVLVVSLLSAIGLGLLLATASERLTSANYVDSVEALNAADAALELAARELSRITDWDQVLAGTVRSAFTDGVAGGTRSIAAFAFNLTTLTNQLTCGRTDGLPGRARVAEYRGSTMGNEQCAMATLRLRTVARVCPVATPAHRRLRRRLDWRRRARSGWESAGRWWW